LFAGGFPVEDWFVLYYNNFEFIRGYFRSIEVYFDGKILHEKGFQQLEAGYTLCGWFFGLV
jgi:hypothetical protein